MKKRWFQFRLSTAIVMMLIASAFLYLNVPSRFIEEKHPGIQIEGGRWASEIRGWPMAAHRKAFYVSRFGAEELEFIRFNIKQFPDLAETPIGLAMKIPESTGWQISGIAIDVLTLLAIVCATGILCECIARRKLRTPYSEFSTQATSPTPTESPAPPAAPH